MSLNLTLLPDRLAVCRRPATTPLPPWAASGGFCSATFTCDETSVVCAEEAVPAGTQLDGGWRAFVVAGPLDFSLTGILLSIAQPLADAGVAIFAVPTYDTDDVLVKEASLRTATLALERSGHRFQ